MSRSNANAISSPPARQRIDRPAGDSCSVEKFRDIGVERLGKPFQDRDGGVLYAALQATDIGSVHARINRERLLG